jgi:hypothetical protein
MEQAEPKGGVDGRRRIDRFAPFGTRYRRMQASTRLDKDSLDEGAVIVAAVAELIPAAKALPHRPAGFSGD